MLEVSKRWRKKAYTSGRDGYFIDPRGRRIPRELIERKYISIGDYVSVVLGIQEPASHFTTVKLIWDYINRQGTQKNFICVEIERKKQPMYGFYVRKDWRPEGLFREAI